MGLYQQLVEASSAGRLARQKRRRRRSYQVYKGLAQPVMGAGSPGCSTMSGVGESVDATQALTKAPIAGNGRTAFQTKRLKPKPLIDDPMNTFKTQYLGTNEPDTRKGAIGIPEGFDLIGRCG
jgi:hypothetical protein